MASRVVCAPTVDRAALTSASSSATRWAAPAWRQTTVMECATVSCRSCAMRSRSSATARADLLATAVLDLAQQRLQPCLTTGVVLHNHSRAHGEGQPHQGRRDPLGISGTRRTDQHVGEHSHEDDRDAHHETCAPRALADDVGDERQGHQHGHQFGVRRRERRSLPRRRRRIPPRTPSRGCATTPHQHAAGEQRGDDVRPRQGLARRLRSRSPPPAEGTSTRRPGRLPHR